MKNSVSQWQLFPAVLLVFLSLVLLPSRYLVWLRPIETAVTTALQPLLHGTKYLEFRLVAAAQTLLNVNSWERDYRRIQAQNWTLSNEIEYLRNEMVETAALKQQLQLVEQKLAQLVFAQITAAIGEAPRQVWRINKGELNGIKKNMPVVSGSESGLVLIGKIFAVQPTSAVVLPLSHPEARVSARMRGSQFSGLVQGGQPYLEMSYISRLAQGEITPGEIVATAGLEGSIFPAGLAIGKVVRIDDLGYQASISAQLELMVDMSQLHFVQVLVAG